MRFDVITLLPELVEAIVQVGVTGRAATRGLIELHCWNPREFTDDVHRTVDDRPYGGGPGMVMKAESLLKTIRAAKEASLAENKTAKVIYLSPQGKQLDQKAIRGFANSFAKKTNTLVSEQGLILLCGRYEGIDERIIELEVDEEWSIGDYILSGGELGAMVIIDAITRLLPDALGHKDSAEQDSFTENLLDCEHFTRPEIVEGLQVPAVLKSGDHKAIARWRRKQAIGRTFQRRADLLKNNVLSSDDQKLLDEYLKDNDS